MYEKKTSIQQTYLDVLTDSGMLVPRIPTKPGPGEYEDRQCLLPNSHNLTSSVQFHNLKKAGSRALLEHYYKEGSL